MPAAIIMKIHHAITDGVGAWRRRYVCSMRLSRHRRYEVGQ